MKKVLLFGAVVAAFTFASCAKDRTCTCTTTNTAPGSVATADVVTFTKAHKGDARYNRMDFTQTVGRYTETTTCTLK